MKKIKRLDTEIYSLTAIKEKTKYTILATQKPAKAHYLKHGDLERPSCFGLDAVQRLLKSRN